MWPRTSVADVTRPNPSYAAWDAVAQCAVAAVVPEYESTICVVVASPRVGVAPQARPSYVVRVSEMAATG